MTPAAAARLRRTLWIALLVGPPLLLMAAFVAWPLASALAFGFYEWRGMARGDFVGLRNFQDVLFGPHFGAVTWRAFGHNVFVFVSLIIIQSGGGFLLAWLLYKEPFGHRFHRVAVFLPVILSTIIVGFLWKLLLHPNFGLINQALIAAGLGAMAKPWLGDSTTALPALVLVNAWHWIGFPALVFLAGMQRIPRELIESARIDGVNEIQLVRKIVWPLTAPSATIVFTLMFIGAFNWFELPYVMAGLDGSPFGSTDVLGLHFYRLAFGNQSAGVQDFGRGSALAAMLFLFIAVIASAMTLYLRRREIEA